jgi:hypothetical protein
MQPAPVKSSEYGGEPMVKDKFGFIRFDDTQSVRIVETFYV